MAFFRFLSPTRAFVDLRAFMAQQRRQPHKAGFLAAAVALTGFFVFLIAHDSRATVAYHRNIIYVQQWRLDRSEAEILAQQKIDKVGEDRRNAEIKAALEKRRLEFKHVDDAMKRWGI